MKTNQLSAAFFNTFDQKPVIINTKLQVTTEEGIGIMSYRGILVDYDDYMAYIGLSLDEITTAIRWDDIATIELFDYQKEAESELLHKKPGSGASN